MHVCFSCLNFMMQKQTKTREFKSKQLLGLFAVFTIMSLLHAWIYFANSYLTPQEHLRMQPWYKQRSVLESEADHSHTKHSSAILRKHTSQKDVNLVSVSLHRTNISSAEPIDKKNHTIDQKNHTIDQKNHTIDQRNQMIDQRKYTVDQKNHMISHKNHTIDQQNHIINQNNPTINPNNHTINKNDYMSDKTNHTIDQKNHAIDTTTGKKLFNYNFAALTDIQDGCADKPDVVIYVHTRPDATDRRDLIRSTYGMVHQHDGVRLRTFFFIGVTSHPDTKEQQRVKDEAAKYNDLVQHDFIDSYRNMTIKHLVGMNWVLEHCPTAQMLVKVDDDVFVNVYRLVEFYKFYMYKHTRFSELVNCAVSKGTRVRRGKRQQWSVTKEEFSAAVYPDYCMGYAEIFSRDAAQRIYDVANITKFLWIDDVFVTGVLREKAGLSIRSHYNAFRGINIKKQEQLNIETTFNTKLLFVLYHVNRTHEQLTSSWQNFSSILQQQYTSN